MSTLTAKRTTKASSAFDSLRYISPRVSQLSLWLSNPRPIICQTIFSNLTILLWTSKLYHQFPKYYRRCTSIAECMTNGLSNSVASRLHLQVLLRLPKPWPKSNWSLLLHGFSPSLRSSLAEQWPNVSRRSKHHLPWSAPPTLVAEVLTEV